MIKYMKKFSYKYVTKVIIENAFKQVYKSFFSEHGHGKNVLPKERLIIAAAKAELSPQSSQGGRNESIPQVVTKHMALPISYYSDTYI